MNDLTTMATYLVWVMEKRGRLSLQQIYRDTKERCAENGRPLPPKYEEVIRQTLQAHCSTAKQYKGKNDFFVMHEPGVWSCKVESPSIEDLA